MRTLITSLCVAATVGAGAFAVAGCGGDDAVGLDVAKASAATAGKGTARVAIKVSVEGAGLPLPVSVDAKGVTALNSSEGNLVFDLAPLLSLAGVQGSSGDLELRFDGGTVHAKPPKLEQLEIPGGKPWVKLELPELAAALGLPSEGLGKLFTLEPAAQLRALEAAKGMKQVGKEDVDGVETTHYRGTFTLADYAATLPARERAEVERGLAALNKLSGETGSTLDDPLPADIWVDEDGVARKTLSVARFPRRTVSPRAR